MRLADAPRHFEPPFVNAAARHACIDQRSDHGLAEPADRNSRLEFVNTPLQKFGMHRTLGRAPRAANVGGRVNPDGGL